MSRELGKKIYILLSVLFLSSVQAKADRILSYQEMYDKAQGMWLGQMAANLAGRSTEGNYSGSSANPSETISWVIPGPNDSWPGDDDTDMEYIALHILETHGLAPSPGDIASQWLDHITSSGIYISNRQSWYLMADGVLPPDTGSRNRNEHWYSIDSQITTETLGLISPGMPQQAIDLAYVFASVSNDGFAVHATQFQVAMYSYSWFESDIENIVENALEAIPQSSRSYQVAADVLSWYRQDISDGVTDWRATRQKLYDHYGAGSEAKGRYYNWIESTVNLGATVMALLYGNGDYKETVRVGVLAGWDCDCNPAIAAGIVGVIKGRDGLPADLFADGVCSEMYKNIYRPHLPNPTAGTPQYESIASITERIIEVAQANILSCGGSIFIQDDVKYYSIIDEPAVLAIQPEKPDPVSPAGLVGLAAAAGITVSPFAAVENFNSAKDLYNLDQIIDGITDNSYNGVRPYRSYSSSAIGRELDYYGVQFPQSVSFDSITFYEGDIVWNGINTDYAVDDRKGGYFEDLAVEVLVDGSFVPVKAAVFSEALDKEKYYQVINITFEPVRSTAIRIVGKPGGSQTFTTILELEPNGIIINADFDNSGKVDLADFACMATSFLSDQGSDDFNGMCDLDNSGRVDLADLESFAEQWLL